MHKKDDRIEELEEALRESVQITAEREMVLAQEESARTQAEKQVCMLWSQVLIFQVNIGNTSKGNILNHAMYNQFFQIYKL